MVIFSRLDFKVYRPKFKENPPPQATITPYDVEVAHKISVRLGGSDDVNNLVALCTSRNASMGTTSFDAFQRISARGTMGGGTPHGKCL